VWAYGADSTFWDPIFDAVNWGYMSSGSNNYVSWIVGIFMGSAVMAFVVRLLVRVTKRWFA